MTRREFIALLGGASVAAWPCAAHAQQPGAMRRVGVLQTQPPDDMGTPAFVQALQELGWREGNNLRIERRFAGGDDDLRRSYATELASLLPDVIFTAGSGATAAMAQATRTIPIVFAQVSDPVEAGYVASLSRPGGNITGFTNFESSLSGKWVDVLKQLAPNVSRAAVLYDPGVTNGPAQIEAMIPAAAALGIEMQPVDDRDAGEMERSVTEFARVSNGCLIVTGSALAILRRDMIVALAARLRLPAIYSDRAYVSVGGLSSYGPNRLDQYRRAAAYVDRILKGEKPAGLPVQAPTKYELMINLKTARALGLEIPPKVLALADEVVE